MKIKERITDMIHILKAVEDLEYHDKNFLHTTISVHKMKLEYYNEILRLLKKLKYVYNDNDNFLEEADNL